MYNTVSSLREHMECIRSKQLPENRISCFPFTPKKHSYEKPKFDIFSESSIKKK